MIMNKRFERQIANVQCRGRFPDPDQPDDIIMFLGGIQNAITLKGGKQDK